MILWQRVESPPNNQPNKAEQAWNDKGRPQPHENKSAGSEKADGAAYGRSAIKKRRRQRSVRFGNHFRYCFSSRPPIRGFTHT